MLTLCVKKGRRVCAGSGVLTVESITPEGFVIVRWAHDAGELYHVLQPETPTGGLQYMVRLADELRVGLSAKQPNSAKQCRVVFDAPRRIPIYRED